jgi:UbiD family decarboxylase
VPGVLEISTPIPWVFRQSAVISVDRQAAKNLHKLVKALWDLPWFSSARLLVFVDKAVRPDQILQVAWRMVNETDWQTGLIRDESGKRLAIDATCKSDGTALSDHTTEELISRRWHEYGFEKP